MREVHFGDGSNALNILVNDSHKDVRDCAWLQIRPGKGCGIIGQPSDPVGSIVRTDDDSIGLFFANTESLDSVIGILQELRPYVEKLSEAYAAQTSVLRRAGR